MHEFEYLFAGMSTGDGAVAKRGNVVLPCSF